MYTIYNNIIFSIKRSTLVLFNIFVIHFKYVRYILALYDNNLIMNVSIEFSLYAINSFNILLGRVECDSFNNGD